MGGQKCHDAMLWIGQSYAQILCDQKPEPFSEYCYIKDNRKQRCYVHEAEMRGCCRKIPRAPKWLVPEKSRIFLIHRDGKSIEQGSIFGYFVLQRFEHIISGKVEEAVTDAKKIPWIEQVCQEIIEVILETIEEEAIGEILGRHRDLIEDKAKEEFSRRWKKGVEEQLIKGYCITPRPKPIEAVHWPRPNEPVEDPLIDILEDILEELIEDWVKDQIKKVTDPLPGKGGKLKKAITGNSDDAYISNEDSMLEGARFCSKRLKVGATYVVDALTAAITDAFAQKLARKRPATIREGEDLFRATIKEVHKKYRSGTLAEIDPRLKDHAVIHRELAVFKQPYPVFERIPRADFRGLLCVDGDKLLDEIAEHYQTSIIQDVHDIPYQGAEKGDIYDPLYMAQTFRVTKHMAEAILLLYAESMKTLKDEEPLTLPKIGTIRRSKDTFSFEAVKNGS